MARQQQLAVTGQNLANADRVGYRRREATVVSSPAVSTPQGEIGTGVQVKTIMRAFDQALETRLHAASRDQQYHETVLAELRTLEDALAPGGTSALGQAMEAFTADLQRLVASPQVSEYRESFLGRAKDLATQIRRDDRQLTNLQAGILENGSGQLPESIDSINSLATQLAELNSRIAQAERSTIRQQPANDLRDERDDVLAQLAREVNLDWTVESDGSYTVRLGSDHLVSGTATRELALDTSSGQPIVQWSDSGDLAGVDSGRLGGLLHAWDYLADRQSELDQFATSLASTVNTTLTAGYTLAGTAGTPVFTGSSADDLSVSMINATRLGFSGTAGLAGDSGQAAALLEALQTPVAALGDTSLRDFPVDFVTDIAREVAAEDQHSRTATATHDMYAQAVTAYSGVSVDEEMINMLQLQRAYQASARFMSVLDDMLQQALSII